MVQTSANRDAKHLQMNRNSSASRPPYRDGMIRSQLEAPGYVGRSDELEIRAGVGEPISLGSGRISDDRTQCFLCTSAGQTRS